MRIPLPYVQILGLAQAFWNCLFFFILTGPAENQPNVRQDQRVQTTRMDYQFCGRDEVHTAETFGCKCAQEIRFLVYTML